MDPCGLGLKLKSYVAKIPGTRDSADLSSSRCRFVRYATAIRSTIAPIVFFLLSIPLTNPVFGAEETKISISRMEYQGVQKTDPEWLSTYIAWTCPCQHSREELEQLRLKLLTTQVFQDVNYKLEPDATRPGSKRLIITFQEKWTIIPVVRGAFGGGTPLLVVGVHDTHAFGKLITLGAETRTYGDAPAGGVAWIRAPRWREGKHYWDLEIWRDNRYRNFYDQANQPQSTLYGSSTALVAEGLLPLNLENLPSWQAGLRLQVREQSILEWEKSPPPQASPPNLNLLTGTSRKLYFKLVYDDMSVQKLLLNGLRATLSLGMSRWKQKNWSTFEHEAFAFHIFENNWNLGWHHWLGISDDVSYPNLYFLGGFDSVRGLPDGLLYGSKAFFGNLEVRKILNQTRFAWFQAAGYLDYGTASQSWSRFFRDDRSTAGIGMRIAVPQVNRLVLRVDYAWSLDQPRTRSISAGMNQFIDPYRPL